MYFEASDAQIWNELLRIRQLSTLSTFFLYLEIRINNGIYFEMKLSNNLQNHCESAIP